MLAAALEKSLRGGSGIEALAEKVKNPFGINPIGV